jgi:PAS domain S-box-containing protein/putative nucleotidyltransferase with HDIG domain
VREPLLVLDADLRVVSANRSFYLTFGVKPEETQGRLIYDLGGQQWDIPRLRELLEEILPENTSFYDFEVDHNFPALGRRVMVLNARRLYSEPEKTRLILLAIQDVTENKRAEERISVSETRYRRLFETAQDGILILDADTGQIVDVNPFLMDMLGYSREEFMGKRLWEISPFKDIEASQEAFKELQSKGYVRYENLPLETKNGQQISLEFVSNVYLVGNDRVIQCNIRDITARRHAEEELRGYRDQLEEIVKQRTAELEKVNRSLQAGITELKQTEQALKESEARYRNLFESAAEGILITDIETKRFRYANPAICNLLGYTNDELLQLRVSDIAPADSLSSAVSKFEATSWETAHLSNVPCSKKDGVIVYADIHMVPALVDGRRCNIGYLTDVTHRMLAEEVRKQNYERLLNTMKATIEAIALTIETRDQYTSGHQKRVTKLACAIATEMGLPEQKIEGLNLAGIVHDIGKMYIPAEILSKPGRLNKIEFDMIKMHPQAGYDILKNVAFPWPIAQVVLQHHERMNGSGYPSGLSADSIFIESRIIAVADVVEAMGSHRPYRPSLGIDKALEEISQNKGILYDTDVVDACLRLFTEKGFTFDGEVQASIWSPVKIG